MGPNQGMSSASEVVSVGIAFTILGDENPTTANDNENRNRPIGRERRRHPGASGIVGG